METFSQRLIRLWRRTRKHMNTANNMTNLKKTIHDLRTHMSIVQVYLQISSAHLIGDEEQVLYKNAQKSLLKMQCLISELLQQASEETVYGYKVSGNENNVHSAHDVHKMSILVIDDDPVAREKTVAKLKEEGNDVIALEKGEDLLTGNIDFSRIRSAVVKKVFTRSALEGADVVEYLRGRGIGEITT